MRPSYTSLTNNIHEEGTCVDVCEDVQRQPRVGGLREGGRKLLGGARRLLRARAAERKELKRRAELTLERRLITQTVRGEEVAASVVSKRLSRGLSEVRKGNGKEVRKRALCEGREGVGRASVRHLPNY